MRGLLRPLAGLVGLPLLAAAATAQQAPPASPQAPVDVVEDYVVQPGDTLQGITERFLGTPRLWRDNWGLNPQVRDPNFLRPGEQLRIIIDRQLPARSAEVLDLSRRVEDKLQPRDWQAARQGDLLKEEDGIRTYSRSSAELGLEDGGHLVLTEDSLVFLRRMRRTVIGTSSDTIEIREGQADLQMQLPRPRSRDIEILVGGATARPSAGPQGAIENRARRGEGGSAQLMVYAGASEVEAAGGRVTVPRGMGTSVPEGGVPRPPERLLAAPVPESPAAGSRWDYGNPRFSWRPLEGAASYTVEVCGDSECGRLVERVVGVTETEWSSQRLPAGELVWRVTAVSASGLDGYPSGGTPFSVLSDRVDVGPPAVVAMLSGAGRVLSDGSLVLGRDGGLLLAAHDDVAGVEEIRYRWGEGEWRRWQGELVEPPPEPGRHLLELLAVDRLGKSSEPVKVTVERVGAPPAPPQVGG